MLVECELSKIIISEVQEQQIVTLRELAEPRREFPIVIGMYEAVAIDRKIKGYKMPRPMTHDLLVSVLEHLGGRLERIVVNDLREDVHMQGGTFYAELEIHRDDEIIKVDCRPSDAIALAVRVSARVFVDESVIQKVALGG